MITGSSSVHSILFRLVFDTLCILLARLPLLHLSREQIVLFRQHAVVQFLQVPRKLDGLEEVTLNILVGLAPLKPCFFIALVVALSLGSIDAAVVSGVVGQLLSSLVLSREP